MRQERPLARCGVGEGTLEKNWGEEAPLYGRDLQKKELALWAERGCGNRSKVPPRAGNLQGTRLDAGDRKWRGAGARSPRPGEGTWSQGRALEMNAEQFNRYF